MNRDQMEDGLRLFLEGLLDGLPVAENERQELLAKTPRRAAIAWAEELVSGYARDPKSCVEPFPIAAATGPVVLRGIEFDAVCAHHLLPFRGLAHVGLVPEGARHFGLGSIARLVDTMARRLCLQESLTADIARLIGEALTPRSVVVALEAEHLCLAARGSRKVGHRLVTMERWGEPDPELERLVCTPPLSDPEIPAKRSTTAPQEESAG